MRNHHDHHDHDHDHIHHDHDDHDQQIGASGTQDRVEDATPPQPRPLGFWLHTLDRLIDDEVTSAFADLDVTRREWRLLNLIAGEARDERLLAELDARPRRLDPLVERGWVAGGPGAWALTGAGREVLDVLTGRIGDIRSRVAGAVSPEDFATTMAALEAISRELGWSEDDEPRERGGRRPGRRSPRPGSRRCGHHDHPGHHGHRGHRGRRGGHGHGDDVHVHVHLHDAR